MTRLIASLALVTLALPAQAQTCPNCPKPTREPPRAQFSPGGWGTLVKSPGRDSKGCACAATGVCGCGLSCGCDLGVFAPAMACQPRRTVVVVRPAPRPVLVIRTGHGRCHR